MSEKEKPLHVRVAEALGCEVRTLKPEFAHGRETWYCGCPVDGDGNKPHAINAANPGGAFAVKQYDQNWAATGPLIEKFNLTLIWDLGWCAFTEVDTTIGEFTCNGKWAKGETPLEAVCNLLLALKEAGKLDA